jgi:Cu/Ag efflux pump CusA
MAMVIMCGLFSSTALNMVVVPILYERFGRPSAVPNESRTEFMFTQPPEHTP